MLTYYEENKFSGNFDNTFASINADPYLIAKSMEIKNAVILTDEIPTKENSKGKLKLNIPNFAKTLDIECFQLKDHINKIIT